MYLSHWIYFMSPAGMVTLVSVVLDFHPKPRAARRSARISARLTTALIVGAKRRVHLQAPCLGHGRYHQIGWSSQKSAERERLSAICVQFNKIYCLQRSRPWLWTRSRRERSANGAPGLL